MPAAIYERPRRTRRRGVPPLLIFAVVFFCLAVLARLFLPVFLPSQPPEPVNPLPDAVPDWVEQALLPVNDYSRPGTWLDAVNGVVVHYTGNPGTTAMQNRNYFAGLAETQETSASSNFIIGLDGEALLCVPVNEVAYASSQRNSDTLSIEVCHPDETGAFNAASYETLVRLVQWAVDTYGLERDQIIRHYDVTGKECPLYYVRNPDAWEVFLDRLAFPS